MKVVKVFGGVHLCVYMSVCVGVRAGVFSTPTALEIRWVLSIYWLADFF